MNGCEYCMYYEYDEALDEEVCVRADGLDEDDYGRMMADTHASCPMFRAGNEYSIMRRQAI